MRSLRATMMLATLALLAGCEPAPPPSEDAGATDAQQPLDAGTRCEDDADCDDGAFCNGAESCVAGRCAAGAPPVCDDGIACTTDRCAEDRARCESTPPDADGDGQASSACVDGAGVPLGGDCDDADPRRFAGNVEVCDTEGHDEDCDDSTRGGLDADGDGFESSECCNAGTCGPDCDDARAGVRPDASEVCDALDQDCDTRIDEGTAASGFADADYDGAGDPARPVTDCAGEGGFALVGGDCDDTDATRRPGQAELCDGLDYACDTRVDESPTAVRWYRDADGDRFGSEASGTRVSCEPILGYVILASDCDDTTASLSPAAPEVCNGRDDDCDGEADFAIAGNDREDDDGDGLADATCGAPFGVDCADDDPSAGPGGAETCDGRDDDCDTRIDEGATSAIWLRDADGDGYGSASSGAILACSPGAGHVARGGDCDDTHAARRPGALETCDGRDDDCDARIDEGAGSRCALAAGAASMACTGGRCAIGACAAGQGDCNGLASDGCEAPLGTALDCGACGDACIASGVEAATCVALACAIGACAGALADCDGEFANGCEVDVSTDPMHCGGCAAPPCALAHATSLCSEGACAIGRCDPGYGDCDGLASNGCESALGTGLDCAACGDVCGAGTTCSMGRCVAPCGAPRLDCDADASNGCEVDGSSDARHCGACGNRCRLPGATSRCSGGSCIVDACLEGWGDCNVSPGCETSLRTLSSCGACGRSCGYPGAYAECLETGVCAMAGCLNGFGDCNESDSDGCETPTTTVDDCGACGRACEPPFAIGFCDMGACRVGGCDPGRSDCDGDPANGCEVAVDTDPTSCGTCGLSCGLGGTCLGGGCDLAIDFATGAAHTCVLRSTGSVACFGDALVGQLGSGVAASFAVGPTLSFGTVVQLEAGEASTCARTTSGEIWCWGANDLAQCGQPAGAPVLAPTRIASISGATALAMGRRHGCAIAVGSVVCWGDNAFGELGRSVSPGALAAPIEGSLPPAAIQSLAAGDGFTCVRTDAGVYCFGRNDRLQLGSAGPGGPTPIAVPLPDPYVDITAGEAHVCAFSASSRVARCWGDDSLAQLARGSAGTASGPDLAPQLGLVRAVRAFGRTTCALRRDYRVAYVGEDSSAECGAGSASARRDTAVLAVGLFARTLGHGASAHHLCAFDTADQPFCWGANAAGQAGVLGTSAPVLVPTRPWTFP